MELKKEKKFVILLHFKELRLTTKKIIVEEKKKTDILNEWVAKKQSETYIRIKEGWRNCEFKYDGWIKK